MKRSFLLSTMLLISLHCSQDKKNSNGLLGLLLLSGSNSSATNAFTAAVPSDFAVTSVTEQTSAASSAVRAPGDDLGAEDFKTKKQNMKDATAAKTVADCFKAMPKAIRQEAGNVSCYGPQLTFTSHSQIAGTQMPGGDLGIWQTTEGSKGEACAAAKANSLIRLVSNRVDMAMGTSAAMACIAKLANLTLPSTAGASLDLGSSFTSNSSGKGFTITTAKMSRLADSGGKPQFQTEFVGTREFNPPGSRTVIKTTMDVTLKQVPNSTSDTSSYKGLVQMTMTDDGGTFQNVRGISIVYEKSGTTLTYNVISAAFPKGTTKAQIFSATTGEVNKASKQGGGVWDSDYNTVIASINEDGIGKMAYGWQAGAGDGYLRTFNAETTAANTGKAYFGFSKNADNKGVYELKPGGMFCNWVTTGSKSTYQVTKLQKQTLSFESGVWKSSQNNTTFAPTNDCDHASSSAVYAGLTSTPTLTNAGVTAAGAVTNTLVNTTDNDIVIPTAPSF